MRRRSSLRLTKFGRLRRRMYLEHHLEHVVSFLHPPMTNLASFQRFATFFMSTSRRLFSMFFIPVVVIHLVWVSPLVEWSCFCPEDEPNHQCCCNCPKCVKNRGGFKSFCHLRPEKGFDTAISKGSSIVSPLSSEGQGWQDVESHGFREFFGCQCDSHIKKISLDIRPFLPQPQFCGIRPFPIVKIIIRNDDWQPPESIPCQPHPPG